MDEALAVKRALDAARAMPDGASDEDCVRTIIGAALNKMAAADLHGDDPVTLGDVFGWQCMPKERLAEELGVAMRYLHRIANGNGGAQALARAFMSREAV